MRRRGQTVHRTETAAPQAPSLEELKAKIEEQTARAMRNMILQMIHTDPLAQLRHHAGGEAPAPKPDALWDGDTLVLKTNRETYRIEARSRRITRVSDGAIVRVEIPWDRPEYRMFRATVDAHDFRQPEHPSWMGVGMLARLLSVDQEAGRIVVDRTAEDS